MSIIDELGERVTFVDEWLLMLATRQGLPPSAGDPDDPTARECLAIGTLLAERGATNWARIIQGVPYDPNELAREWDEVVTRLGPIGMRTVQACVAKARRDLNPQPIPGSTPPTPPVPDPSAPPPVTPTPEPEPPRDDVLGVVPTGWPWGLILLGAVGYILFSD